MKSRSDEEEIQPIRNLKQKYLLTLKKKKKPVYYTKRDSVNFNLSGLTNPLRKKHQKTDWYGPPNATGKWTILQEIISVTVPRFKMQKKSINKSRSMEKAKATHSSTLAWKIPWTEEPGGLQSMGSLRVGHDWVTSLSLFTFLHWRRQWQPTPVFLPGESQGRGSLVGCRLWGRTESDTTDAT